MACVHEEGVTGKSRSSARLAGGGGPDRPACSRRCRGLCKGMRGLGWEWGRTAESVSSPKCERISREQAAGEVGALVQQTANNGGRNWGQGEVRRGGGRGCLGSSGGRARRPLLLRSRGACGWCWWVGVSARASKGERRCRKTAAAAPEEDEKRQLSSGMPPPAAARMMQWVGCGRRSLIQAVQLERGVVLLLLRTS